MFREIFISIRCFILMMVITGILYPLAITAISQLVFSHTANGSLVYSADGKLEGSRLLAQKFVSNKFFWPRPSAADYGTVASGASNQGWTSKALKGDVASRAEILRRAHGLSSNARVPDELLLTSGSGLDPDLSPEAVEFQKSRVVHARGWNKEKAHKLDKKINQLTHHPFLGIIGKPTVNILDLNLAVDEVDKE